ncbi:MAG: hypothetical protein HY858_05895 [Candidatus Solibacter usitatus]|nr:hypothetical protein [Candidatus Solibacter usitatus]
MPTIPFLRAAWRPGAFRGFRTGVSLHSHTSHSRESLDFIPRFAAACPPVAALLRRYEARYRRLHERELDYAAAWWTPPLGPREALILERNQIEQRGLAPFVSITDHDNVEAPLLLRVLGDSRDTPVGVEWTVPWRGTFFHLGLHNIPPRRAAERIAELNRFTANPDESLLPGLFDWIAESPDALIVFNHPYWDEKDRGCAFHARLAEDFLHVHRPWIHALEINGLRPWSENRRAVALAASAGMPLISGGDRHGCEPNALLNLTSAPTFSEFVAEVREDGFSCIALMPQFREPLLLRLLSAFADVMRDNEAHTYGWARWNDRVFFRRHSGQVEPLSAAFAGGREPSLIRLFAACARLLDNHRLHAVMRGLQRSAPEFEL